MQITLKILLLEDSDEDAGLVLHELNKHGFTVISKIVETRIDFEDALIQFKPDVILSDHSLPGFDSLEALKIYHERKSIVPFILVTGAVSEEFAVQIIHEGADDYILKDKLTRLPRAITMALEKRNLEQQKEKAELDLISRNSELKNLSTYLKNIREDERKQISRDVHDELGQLASAIKMDADWLNLYFTELEQKAKIRIDRILSTSNIMIETIRTIAIGLRPMAIEELGINASLKFLCSEFQRLHNIECHFEAMENDETISLEVRTEFYRICQECVTNILRHANATSITIRINETNDSILLKITDNGKGFDINQKTTHLGLVGMRERAYSINGELKISSEPGEGTTILVIVPKN